MTYQMCIALMFPLTVTAIASVYVVAEISKFRKAYEIESNRYWDKYLRRLSSNTAEKKND